jgi:serine/threonine-protein phosphatase 5
LAVKDFRKVCQLLPNDKDAREKYAMTQKEWKAREFAKCIVVEEKKIQVNLDDMIVEEKYQGLKLNSIEDLNSEWVLELMGRLSKGEVLHKKFAFMIILRCRELFEKDKSLVHISVPDD